MFTQGQVDRMRAALQVSSTGRTNLWKASNLSATGATGDLYLCKAEFDADRTTICSGNEIFFTDDSYNVVSSWSWTITPSTGWSFTNGTDANSQNPSMIFDNEGLYTISLNASDGTSSDVETKNNYIRVLPASAVLPYWEGFEDYTSLENLTNWEIINLNNNNAFNLATGIGYTGNKCARLVNYGQQPSNVDELISEPIDMSGVPETGQVTLSFRYSYRKRTSSDYEFLKVFVSNDCGGDWSQRKTLGGNLLSNQVSSSYWQPSSQADWKTIHMGNVFSDFFVENFRMKFRFEGEGGNNFYIDDINLYEGSSSDDISVGVEELGASINMSVYPNPTEADVSVEFHLNSAQKMTAQIIDVRGKVIETHLLHANEGKNILILETNQLSQGSYTIKLNSSTASSSMPFYKI